LTPSRVYESPDLLERYPSTKLLYDILEKRAKDMKDTAGYAVAVIRCSRITSSRGVSIIEAVRDTQDMPLLTAEEWKNVPNGTASGVLNWIASVILRSCSKE
jgi:hypothetical protein